jgi:hypothetical protein
MHTQVCSTSSCPAGTCTGRGGFAVAAGLIPLLLCAAYVILTKYHRAPSRSRVALAAFSFCWWTLSVGVSVFNIPVGRETCNGRRWGVVWNNTVVSLPFYSVLRDINQSINQSINPVATCLVRWSISLIDLRCSRSRSWGRTRLTATLTMFLPTRTSRCGADSPPRSSLSAP